MSNPHVYFDVSIGGNNAGRIEMELYKDTVPKTVKNFLELCKEQQEGKGYKNCPFHRIIPGFMAQGGTDRSISNPNPQSHLQRVGYFSTNLVLFRR